MSVMDLVEFLRARLDEDAYIADELEPTAATRRLGDRTDALRRLVAWCETEGRQHYGPLYFLALPYSDHPDYDPAWAVTPDWATRGE